MTVHITPVGAEDQTAWRGLWTGYLTFYKSAVTEEVYQSTFRRLLTEGPYEPSGLLAWEGATAVGLVHFLYHRHCWRTENVCYLQDLFTAPEARGKGVARALIEAVYQRADEAGAPTVYWTTAEDNMVARSLYDRVARKTEFIKYQR